MKRGQNTDSTTQTRQNPSLQTPDKPPSGTRRPATANAAKLQSWCDPLPSSSFSARSSKRNHFPSTRDQTTLTQIDFVTPTPQPARSDESLRYLNNKRPQRGRADNHEVIELDDDSDHDEDYRPPSGRQPRGARGVRFEEGPGNTSTGQSKSARQRDGDSKQKRRKSGASVKGNKIGKDAKKGNKTLTQMDYVRRYLKIEPDDEVKLEYTYATPNKSDRRKTPRRDSGTLVPQPDHFLYQEPTSGGKKRKLSMTADAKAKLADEEIYGPQDPGSVTPRAKRELEIPSSHSPESSGIAVITSSQFRTAIRSPQKHDLADTAGRCVKQELPSPRWIKTEVPRSPPLEIPESNESLPAAVLSDSPSPRKSISDQGSITLLSEQLKSEQLDEQQHGISAPIPTTQRTVVYETDAETDYGDLEDDLPNPIETPRMRKVPHYDPGAVNLEHEDATEESSQALPLITTTQMEKTEQPPPDDNLTSEASIYYQRIQPATQFPLGPVPNLDTQRLAELFPDEQPNNESVATTLSTESSKAPERLVNASETQSLSSRTRNDSDSTLTDIVPESSPIVRQDDVGSVNFRTTAHRLASRDIVQVESSQPADRHRSLFQNQEDSGPRFFRKSDFLTSSVMESIPLPVFLMDSQDTVGEPYSSPKGA
ncbi:uncharacterized protein BP01DRAFT_355570 [Aspergillus saccharolyticus JOP 1030-1]|uniref:Uncharacterized protein n=1 Tax=Aspergillus saccharolyticus JOP 1030-1 TaxID=1450539 RepID=A0A319A2W4_9EURO|nr:hypothetical protein BP01DRAFT_355570 [Aspergillus saccharolyticus JOP 1030-1]PYH46558.1 hypothetical protein BP01DRAFT_355570 [Aspergillus saccharolyticus JOP 1030-1]